MNNKIITLPGMIKITKDVAREVIENPEKYPNFYKKADTENISLN